jgi:hypothetical protein
VTALPRDRTGHPRCAVHQRVVGHVEPHEPRAGIRRDLLPRVDVTRTNVDDVPISRSYLPVPKPTPL